MRAIILAAGEGKRLQPLTLNKPKPLLEIRGQSILENMINYLKKSGIEDIIVVTGYKYQLFYKLQKKLNFQQIIFKDYQGVNSAETLKFVAKYIHKGNFYFKWRFIYHTTLYALYQKGAFPNFSTEDSTHNPILGLYHR
ncbi:hypothetical protein CDV25_06405 [Helicobacter apodemus]|uniref:Nucleotidyl transferase domain-containing protein n=1 Tax=Helicobacter apodemus TaxID=135569 RepID=A0A2U8FDV4_9HELI|nr:hypothetical protein CDV25_06405 [Helicobacter apodemus]